MKRKSLCTLAVILLCSCAFASTTTLTGTIVDSQGNPMNGTLTMRLPVPAQDTTLNVAVAPTLVTFNLVNGSIVGGAPLKDVATLQPQGLYYIGRAYDLTGALQFYGNFLVTGASFNLGAATPTQITTSNVSYVLPIFPGQTNTFTATQSFVTIASSSTPVASTGVIRFATGDQECWRNISNTADVCIGYGQNTPFIPAGDFTTFSGGLIVSGGIVTAGAGNGLNITTTTATGGQGPNVTVVADVGRGTNTSGGSIILAPGTGNGAGPNGVVQIEHGIGISSGLQHKRTASCTTGAGAGATCTTTVTWSATFDSTAYSAVCTISGGTGAVTGTPSVLSTSTKTTSTMVVTIGNNTAVASSGTLDCVGLHD